MRAARLGPGLGLGLGSGPAQGPAGAPVVVTMERPGGLLVKVRGDPDA